jgi:small-conductance mechanosensitive channel
MVIWSLLIVAGAVVAACLLGWLSGVFVRWLARVRGDEFWKKLHLSCHRPWTLVLVVGALYFTLTYTNLSEERLAAFRHGLLIAFIASTAWLLVKVVFVAEDVALKRLPKEVANNRRIRKARTQITLLRRLTALVITVIATGSILTTFAPLRAFGESVLASAGVAGVILGFAAHTTLGNVVAGLQLAFTDALRIDDVVAVEDEWGRIEEVRLTYVVLRLWDERRMMLPTSYFTTRPYENWTRHEARVLAAVTLNLDFTADVEDLRKQTLQILEHTALWDRAEWTVQVIDASENSMIIRALASAGDGPSAWDLRSEVREKLIAYLRDKHPEWLPRTRGEFNP